LVERLRAKDKGSEISISVHKVIEYEVLEHYYKETGEVWHNAIGYFKDYDGISISGKRKIEIKFEEKARETFNFCIEYEFGRAPSGIASTKAGKWVHVVPMDQSNMWCYEFEVKTLQATLERFPLYSGGDGNKSRMKLLPMELAEKIKTDKFQIHIDWNALKPYW
jgi:hypothetical protein